MPSSVFVFLKVWFVLMQSQAHVLLLDLNTKRYAFVKGEQKLLMGTHAGSLNVLLLQDRK